MDALTDFVERAHAHGSLFAQSELRGPWGFGFDPDSAIRFHVVVAGSCILRMDGDPELVLHQGDIALIAASASYEIASDRSAAVVPFTPLRESARARRSFTWPGSGPLTRLLCGAWDIGEPSAPPLATFLPSLLHLSGPEVQRRPALRGTVALLLDELRTVQPGGHVMVDRLVDTLLVQVLRAWIETTGEATPRWSAAMSDPVAIQVLELAHADPGAAWSVEDFARRVGLSRSALARRFVAALGEPVMAYVTRLRMTRAAEQLRGTRMSVSQIATLAGYDSVFSFSAAFKRQMGQSPSAFRGQARPGEQRRGVAGSA